MKSQEVGPIKNNVRTIKVSIKSGFEVLQMNSILYIKADSNYSIFYCTDRPPIMVSKPLGSYEDKLKKFNFFRIHKSTIVNLSFIKGYKHYKGHYVTLYNDNELQIARRRIGTFMQTIDQYLGEA